MGAHASGRRALASFFALALGIVLLFGAVALVALRPVDNLAWAQVPDLTADLRLDAGLQSKPLKSAVIAEALQDEALTGNSPQALAVQPALAAPPPPVVAVNPIPATRPVTQPNPAPPAPTTTPSTGPTASPTPSPTPAPTASPAPSPTPVGTPTPAPTPTPTPRPTPTPTPTPRARLVITSASETVTKTAKGSANRCSQTTVTATGSFTTNGAGGWVFYEWIRVDSQGNRTVINELPIYVAPGDTSAHAVRSDVFTPAHSGSDQLVILFPAYSVSAQNWSCNG